MSNGTSRLFLALWPEVAMQEAIQHSRDQWSWPATVALVPRASLHLTLHFLGSVPDARLPELTQGLKVSFDSFELSIGRPRLWSHGIAVLEPDLVPVELLKLHALLAEKIQRLGLPTDTRTFRPHVTLARHATGVHLGEKPQPQFATWHVHSYSLVKSQRASPMNSYSVVHTFSHGE